VSEAGGTVRRTAPSRARWLAPVAFAAGCALYAWLQLGALGHPLFWQDEGETAMFGRRILEHGYPRVHGTEGVVYGMGVPLELAVDAERDAYLGSLWGQYYLAAAGVAWAEGAADDHARTARVRLPFALAGIAGLLALGIAMRRELSARSGRPWPAAAAYVLLLCAATSLQLHVREARYYGPTLGLVGLVVWLDRRALRPDARRPRLAASGQALALFTLVNVFYPAAIALVAWIGLECALAVRAARKAGESWPAGLGHRLAPAVVAALAAIPVVFWFDVPGLSQVFAERWQSGPATWLANLAHLAWFLLRYEMLAPVLVAEALLVAARMRGAAVSPPRRAASALLRLVAVYALVGAGNPIFFERYFVPLGPILTLVLVLDGEALAGLRGAASRIRPRVALAVVALATVAVVALRQAEWTGRVREIVDPVAGPIDFVIDDLRARHADPARLLVATNYEAEPLMFYLGSRVVGRFHSARPEAIAAERAVRPDVVIPRTGQGRRLDAVRRYLLDGGYVRRTLGVADVPYNTIPELYAGRVLSRTHWFTTPLPGEDGPPLAVYTREGLPEDGAAARATD